MRKQTEQDLEEHRQANDNLGVMVKQWEQKLQSAREPSTTPWWQRGQASKCPALNDELSENAKRCPAMFDKQGNPKTELDAYETMQIAQVGSDATSAGKEMSRDAFNDGSVGGSGLGYDGKQRRARRRYSDLRGGDRHTNISATKPGPEASSDHCETQLTSRYLSPFENPHHTIPWLLVNPYSPVFLCNADQPYVGTVRLQQGVNKPFRILHTHHLPPPFIQFNDRRDELARQLPWADAFEDLLSIQQKGEMVDRDYSTFKTPKTWIHDMVQRGSLGPTWGFTEQGELTKKSKNLPWAEDEIVSASPNLSASIELSPDNILTSAIAAIARAAELDLDEERLKKDPEGWLTGNIEKMKKLFDDDDPEEDTPVDQPSQAEQSFSSTTWSSSESKNNLPDNPKSESIISSTTTTERWTKPDGSIETRRVFKKRFADGREVEEETHEFGEPQTSTPEKVLTLENAPWPVGLRSCPHRHPLNNRDEPKNDKQTQTATPVQDELKKQRKQGGWFWNH